MLYRVSHTTRYEYNRPVGSCHNFAYVLPRDTLRQNCRQVDLRVSPAVGQSHKRTDYFGNRVYHFSIDQSHSTLEVTANSLVDVQSDSMEDELDLGNTCGRVRQLLRESGDRDTLLAREFILPSPLVEHQQSLRDYAAPFMADDRPFLSAVRDLTQQIYQDFQYDPDFSDVTTPLSEVFRHRRGVCQDFAHLAIGCIRALGFPARYISGYLETLPPPGQQKLVGSDASHAWFGVYAPGEGWFEFDPTNDRMAGNQHIVTAWGRDYADVPPLRGVIFGGGGGHKLSVAVDVNRA